MANTHHLGSCHCGKVTFEADLDLEKPVTACNCSICKRSGSMLAFIPAAQFKLKSGEEALTDYQWGRKHIHHLFCSTCGIKSFARGAMPDGSPIAAVNVRCLEGVDLEKLKVNHFDGAKL
jgi:hypothetical protein